MNRRSLLKAILASPVMALVPVATPGPVTFFIPGRSARTITLGSSPWPVAIRLQEGSGSVRVIDGASITEMAAGETRKFRVVMKRGNLSHWELERGEGS
jgi:hypothetical protein